MGSEFDIISLVRARARTGGGVIAGIGDDAAVLDLAVGSELIASCDLVVEGVHFQTDWAPPEAIGHKALAASISDVAAMGGKPRFAMISIAIPPRLPAGFASELIQGVLDVAERYEVAIVGGDTSASLDTLFVDATVLGECVRGKAVRRSGAKPGDSILVSGSLGASALGLRLLEEGLRLETVVNDAQIEAIGWHLLPEPRVQLGRAIGERGLANSMIDISDGLSTDLVHILEESSCGAILRAEAIPVAHCVSELAPARGIDAVTLALNSGEEYELLLTAPPGNALLVIDLAATLNEPIAIIGEITEDKRALIDWGGKIEELSPGGFEHRF